MTGETISQAIAKRDNSAGALVATYKADFGLVLPTHVNLDHFVRVAQGLLRRNPTLARVAQQNAGSFLSAMLDCARLGLEPGDTYHLVPFGNEVVGITDWKGEVELIYRAGGVESIHCEIVCENDEFDWDPATMAKPHYRADWLELKGDRGEMVGVYAYADMRGGGTSQVIVMNRRQIDEIRKLSKTATASNKRTREQSIWNQWPDRAWKKTAIKQLSKWIPRSPEYRAAPALVEVAASVSPELQDRLPLSPNDPDDEPIDAELIDEDNERPFS